jgi:hypothetical protein
MRLRGKRHRWALVSLSSSMKEGYEGRPRHFGQRDTAWPRDVTGHMSSRHSRECGNLKIGHL